MEPSIGDSNQKHDLQNSYKAGYPRCRITGSKKQKIGGINKLKAQKDS
jgi:hypothetical protein